MVTSENGKKWIYAFTAIISLIVAYVSISFLNQMSEWFDLEAKVPNFILLTQFVGILSGVACFFIIIKNTKSARHMDEVYGELVKVIWPDKDSVVKLAIGIMIGVAIASGLLLLMDFVFISLLEMIY